MQIFHRSTNTISRVSLFGAVFFVGLLLWLFYALEASPYTTQQNAARHPPVPFSPRPHARAAGARLEPAFAAGALVRTPEMDLFRGDLVRDIEQDGGETLGGKRAEAARFIMRAIDRELDRA